MTKCLACPRDRVGAEKIQKKSEIRGKVLYPKLGAYPCRGAGVQGAKGFFQNTFKYLNEHSLFSVCLMRLIRQTRLQRLHFMP